MSVQLDSSYLEKAIRGDLESFCLVLQQSHSTIREWSTSLPHLVLNKEALVEVLKALQLGYASPELVQKWASFVRRGYVARGLDEPVQPIAIDYEPLHESEIAEVVSRLDEIGDTIDGEIGPDEMSAMIERFSK